MAVNPIYLGVLLLVVRACWRCLRVLRVVAVVEHSQRAGGGLGRRGRIAATQLQDGRRPRIEHAWSTVCAVTVDGGAWYSNQGSGFDGSSAPGDSCGLSNKLASSGGSHTVTNCYTRVLARCRAARDE